MLRAPNVYVCTGCMHRYVELIYHPDQAHAGSDGDAHISRMMGVNILEVCGVVHVRGAHGVVLQHGPHTALWQNAAVPFW